jgi:Leucine-rich repeat (LRR) protein
MYTDGSVSNKLEWASLQEQKSLRTLLVVGDIQIKPGDSLVNFSSLRMLHLNSTNCEAFVESLCQLKHLRYLGMEDCGISFLPENIGKMKFLQFISFASNERLVKLPCSILELGQLKVS